MACRVGRENGPRRPGCTTLMVGARSDTRQRSGELGRARMGTPGRPARWHGFPRPTSRQRDREPFLGEQHLAVEHVTCIGA